MSKTFWKSEILIVLVWFAQFIEKNLGVSSKDQQILNNLKER